MGIEAPAVLTTVTLPIQEVVQWIQANIIEATILVDMLHLGIHLLLDIPLAEAVTPKRKHIIPMLIMQEGTMIAASLQALIHGTMKNMPISRVLVAVNILLVQELTITRKARLLHLLQCRAKAAAAGAEEAAAVLQQ